MLALGLTAPLLVSLLVSLVGKGKVAPVLAPAPKLVLLVLLVLPPAVTIRATRPVPEASHE